MTIQSRVADAIRYIVQHQKLYTKHTSAGLADTWTNYLPSSLSLSLFVREDDDNNNSARGQLPVVYNRLAFSLSLSLSSLYFVLSGVRERASFVFRLRALLL